MRGNNITAWANSSVHTQSPPSAQAGIPTGLDTGCSPEAGVYRCAPSTHSSRSRYLEVPSHDTLIVGGTSHCNALCLQSSQTCTRTPAVQHCQNSSAPNIPAAKHFQRPRCWKAGHFLGGSAKCCCSDTAVQGLERCFPPRADIHQDVAGVALWGCDPSSGSDLQASLFALGWKLPPTPEHKLISSLRALGKHLESNRNPPHSFLEVVSTSNPFPGFFQHKMMKTSLTSSHFIGQLSSLSTRKSKGRPFPGAICPTSATLQLCPCDQHCPFETCLPPTTRVAL